jgi:hypothetical protein
MHRPTGVEERDRFGRHRQVGEHKLPRLSRFRCLTIRPKRRADLPHAFIISILSKQAA